MPVRLWEFEQSLIMRPAMLRPAQAVPQQNVAMISPANNNKLDELFEFAEEFSKDPMAYQQAKDQGWLKDNEMLLQVIDN